MWAVIGNDATYGYTLLAIQPENEQYLTAQEAAALLDESHPDVQAILGYPGNPGNPRDQGTKWNPDDKSASVTLSSADFIASSNVAGEWHSVRTSVGKTGGKWYWEINILKTPIVPDKVFAGAAVGGTNLTGVFPGAMNNSAGTQSEVQHVRTWTRNIADTFGRLPDVRDTVYGFALDVPAGRLWVARNDQWLGGGDPVANTNPWVTGVTSPVFPCVGLSSTTGEVVSVRIDCYFARCKYEPPAGYRFLG